MDSVRDYRRADAGQLVEAYNQLHPAWPLTGDAFHQRLEDAIGDDGRIWVAEIDGRPIAYTLIAPIPGLPGMAHLEGMVAREQQRQGVGGRLLHQACDIARKMGWRQLSSPVKTLDSPAGCFLQKHGFTLEHEEVIFRYSLLQQLPELSAAPPGEIVALPRRKAIPRFCTLYQHAFAGLPWAQPYSQAEVAWLLQAAEDLLFLRTGKDIIGFAWLQFDTPQLDEQLRQQRVGLIEPIGVLPDYQGQGYGRFLVAAALRELQRRGAQQAQIGTWLSNTTAVALYKSLGFEFHDSVYYLTREVGDVVC